MTLNAAEVRQAVLNRNETRVRELLRGATEVERRACAAELAEFLAEKPVPGWSPQDQLVFTPAFGVAGLGLARNATIAYRAWNQVHLTPQSFSSLETVLAAITGVLADRAPRWLAKFADRMLRESWAFRLAENWQIVRHLVNHGLIDKPEDPGYTVGMLAGIGWWRTEPGKPLVSLLRADPGLLADEVWQLFTSPEAAATLGPGHDYWAIALATLAGDGTISRDRLIDACLDAFLCGFPSHHVGWYLNLHGRLDPSGNEKAARTGKYLALLSATSTTGVTLGQRECGALLETGMLDPEAFLAASPPALLFPVKRVVTAHLRMIDALIKAHPDVHDEALATVASAFGHEREDLQAAAVKLIKKHGVPAHGEARAAIERLAETLSPVITPDAAALGLVAETEIVTGGPPPQSPAGFAASAIGPAAGISATRVQPIEDADELIQSLARLLEDASDMLEVERVTAAAVRLTVLPLAERARLAAPLLKRAQAKSWPDAVWTILPVDCHLSYLLVAWATGELEVRTYPEWVDNWESVWPPLKEKPDPAAWDPADPRRGILSVRLWEACHLIVAGTNGPLLAEPEFTDGTITRATLLRRLADWRPGSGGPPRADLEAALLRLELNADDTFWTAWESAPVVTAGEAPSAPEARAMYDDGHTQLDFEPVFIPGGVESRRGRPWPPPEVRARLTTPAAADSMSRCWRALVTGLDDPERHKTSGYWAVLYSRELALLLPHQPELAAANLLPWSSLGLAADWSASRAAADGDADAGKATERRRLGRMFHLMLVTALASVNPDTQAAAASAWVRAALDGRLDPDLAAEAITSGIAAEVYMPKRIAESLDQAALDPAAAVSTGVACAAASAALLPDKPRDLHLLLEIATRCYATAGSARPIVPAAIEDLARSGNRSKLADAARRLLRLAHPQEGVSGDSI